KNRSLPVQQIAGCRLSWGIRLVRDRRNQERSNRVWWVGIGRWLRRYVIALRGNTPKKTRHVINKCAAGPQDGEDLVVRYVETLHQFSESKQRVERCHSELMQPFLGDDGVRHLTELRIDPT